MLWPPGVGEGVMENLERALAFACRKLERFSLGVGDRHRHAAVVLRPQQLDLDPVARARSSSRVIGVRDWWS